MASGTADTYTGDPGVTLYAGRAAPASLPAWLAGTATGQLIAVPETVDAYTLNSGGQRAIDAYSGFAVREASSEIFFACQGGHEDGSDNGIISLDLRADTPTWVIRKAGSTPTYNSLTGYYADGTPAARHTYSYIHWSSQIDELVLPGCRFAYGSQTYTYGNVDTWNPVTGLWSTTGAGQRPDVGGSYGVVTDKFTGEIWARDGAVYNPVANTVTYPSTSGSWGLPANGGRYPAAYDSLRRRAFFFQWGNGEGYNSGVNASELDFATKTGRVINFNASAALTQFTTDGGNGSTKVDYLGMDYDPINDRYLVRAKDRFYEIKPNSTAMWDISFFTPTGLTPIYSISGLMGRFKYVPALGGFIEMANSGNGCHFLKV